MRPKTKSELDRVCWPAKLRFTAYGVRIGIRTSSKHILDQILPVLPPNRKAWRSAQLNQLYSVLTGPNRGQYSLYAGERKVKQSKHLSVIIEKLESEVNFFIAESSQNWAFVHAGAVGWKGRAIVIPGASFSGKSSLVTALLAQGAEYYSDEFAALDVNGRVYAFPRRLSLRSKQKRPTFVIAKDLGAQTGTRPLPIGLVVATAYKQGAVWNPKLLSPGETMLTLLENSLSGRTRPEHTLAVLAKALSKGLFLSGNRGDAKLTSASILELLERLV